MGVKEGWKLIKDKSPSVVETVSFGRIPLFLHDKQILVNFMDVSYYTMQRVMTSYIDFQASIATRSAGSVGETYPKILL